MKAYFDGKHIHNAHQTIQEGIRELEKNNLAALIFKGTDIPDLANYPKKPKTKF